MSHDIAHLRATLTILVTIGAASAALADSSRFPVTDTTYWMASEFGPESLLVREVAFDAPVVAAEVDSASGMLLVCLSASFHASAPPPSNPVSLFTDEVRRSRLLAYDLHARRIAWEDAGKAYPLAATANRAVLLRGEANMDLIRITDGRKLADLFGTQRVWSDGMALKITDGAVEGWALQDGKVLWKVERDVRGALDVVIRSDSVLYLVADGIQKVHLRKGSLWACPVRASRSSFYGHPEGGTVHVRSMFGGNRAERMSSRPLIQEPDIFFAADTMVYRLDARSGIVRWRRPLRRGRNFSLAERALGVRGGQEFLGNLLIRDAGENLAVASLGWASGPKNDWVADPPSLALVAKSDGRTLARVQIPGVRTLTDAWSTRHGHYVIADDRVIVMDDRLNVRATLRALPELKPFRGFMEVDDRVLVWTAQGIAALSPDSLRILWAHPCGRWLAGEREPDQIGASYVATTQGLLRFDAEGERRPSAYYPLRASWASFVWNGVVSGAGSKVRLVVLPDAAPIPRPD